MITNYSESTTSNETDGSDQFFVETIWNNIYNTNASVRLHICKQRSTICEFCSDLFFFPAGYYHCLSDRAVQDLGSLTGWLLYCKIFHNTQEAYLGGSCAVLNWGGGGGGGSRLGNTSSFDPQEVLNLTRTRGWRMCSGIQPAYYHIVDSSWNVKAHGEAREGKWKGNWRMEWVASTLHTTAEHGVSSITTADAHISAASSWLNWRPRRFKWTRPFRRKTKSGFCACAITFQLASTSMVSAILHNWWPKRFVYCRNRDSIHRRGKKFFLISKASSPTRPVQPLIQCETTAVALGIKRQEPESDHYCRG